MAFLIIYKHENIFQYKEEVKKRRIYFKIFIKYKSRSNTNTFEAYPYRDKILKKYPKPYENQTSIFKNDRYGDSESFRDQLIFLFPDKPAEYCYDYR